MQSYAPPEEIGIPASLNPLLQSRVKSRSRINPAILDAFSIATLLFVIMICIVLVWDTRRWTQATAEQAELGVVQTIASDVRHNIRNLDVAVTATTRALQLPGIWDLPQALRQAALFSASAQVVNLSMILVIGADGQLRGMSNNQAPPAVNFSDREYFKFHKAHPDVALRISPPIRGRLTQSPIILVSKRVNDDRGNFAGVVTGSIDLSYFNEVFEKNDIGGNGVIALLDTTGQIFARLPAGPQADQVGFTQTSAFKQAVTSLRGSSTSVSGGDGRQRLVAFRAIDGFPFVVGYARDTKEIFAQWLGISSVIGAMAVVLSCLKLLMIYELRRERSQRAVAERSAQASAEALSVVNADLEQRIGREVQSLKETQEKLAKSQRLEALGQLAGGIAHDINNVLQTVSGACSLVQECDPDNADLQRLTAIALSAADRGSAVTQRLLLFARRAAIKTEDVNTAAVLDDLRELLSHALCDSVILELDLTQNLPEIQVDRLQLETVIINLTTNARDAMPDGGIITIGARAAVVGRAEEASVGLAAGRYVCLSLIDTGMGMDERIMSRATEPFFSTKGVGKGTGLGLSMAKGFADQSHGKLEILSRVGEGTTVTLWLPASEQSARNEPLVFAKSRHSNPPVAENPDQGNLRVLRPAPLRVGARGSQRALVVDDNIQARELVAEGLIASGFEVHQAESGEAALSAVRAGLEVDFLLTDFSMPEMDGHQLIQELRVLIPELPAILLTGNTGAVLDLPALSSVGTGYVVLQKPMRMKELVQHIERLVGSMRAPAMMAQTDLRGVRR